MIRQIIKIDEVKCNGCGLCVTACHEGAIGIKNEKAILLRDDYCDGLGNCLPVCPMGAISFEEREAAAYDDEAVKANMKSAKTESASCGCPGSQMKTLKREEFDDCAYKSASVSSHLNQWPVQIKLAPYNAPYFSNADLLIAADCTAYAYGNFHADFMKGKITLIGCPKLDDGDYTEKLTAIFKANDIESVTVARMEVPCCGGIENAVKTALHNSGKNILAGVVILTTDGAIKK